MAKPFGHINLEQRYYESVHSKENPQSQQLVDQGYSSLSSRPQFPLELFTLPFTNTQFRSSINLRDRLKQPELGTTEHLPDAMLSDYYTNFIKITPFGVLHHTSPIQIHLPDSSVNQGSVDLLPFLFDSLRSQGITVSNGGLQSHLQLIPSQFSITEAQGIFYAGGYLQSQIQIHLPHPVNQGDGIEPIYSIDVQGIQLLQGPGIDPPHAISIELVSILQGPSITPEPSDPVDVIAILQGPGTDPTPSIPPSAVIFSQGVYVGVDGLRSITDITTTTVHEQSVPSYIDITPSPGVGDQGGVDPSKIVFEPDRTAPVLSILKYEADRVLAYFTPIIKHGSARLSSTNFGQDFLPEQGESTITTPTPSLLSGDSQTIGDSVQSAVSFPPSQGEPGQGSLAAYRVLSYGQIRQRASKSSPIPQPDFRTELDPNIKPSKSVESRGVGQDGKDDFVTIVIRSLTGGGSISFRAYMTAFTDSWSPSWKDINYVGRQDTLKAFTGATRSGGLSLKIASFNKQELRDCYSKLNKLTKIAAVGKSSAVSSGPPIGAVLQGGALASNTDIHGGGTVNYLTGPVCTITVGKWLVDTPCVFNSLKYDVQALDYSWDIDEQMPQVVDLSMDFTILGDVKGRPLNASSNDYFGYRG